MVIHKDSHLDHGLTNEQLTYIIGKFEHRDGFFIETFELPGALGVLSCSLYGPAMGDDAIPETDVFYRERGDRKYRSRLSRVLRPRKTRTITVIAGPHDGHSCVLYTVYGGPCAPKEPGDPTLRPEDREASLKFWNEHALAVDD